MTLKNMARVSGRLYEFLSVDDIINRVRNDSINGELSYGTKLSDVSPTSDVCRVHRA